MYEIYDEMFLHVPGVRLVFSPLLVVILHVEEDISVLLVCLQPGQQPQHSDGAVLTIELIQPLDLGLPAALSEHLPGDRRSGDWPLRASEDTWGSV